MGTLLKQFMGGVGGGRSWPSYWAKLISATVENAAPTDVVLTFPSAAPSLGASDFTIAGFTIFSASWTGAVLTLVVAEPVTVFHGDITLTFNRTGTDITVTNNVADDGNSIAWYNWESELTLNGVDVTAQADKLGGIETLTGNGYPVLTAEGIYCNKTKSARLVRNWADKAQPLTIFIYAKLVAPESLSRILGDENVASTLQYVAGGVLYATSDNGANHITVNNVPTNEFITVSLIMNGANSVLQLNNNTKTTGNVGLGAIKSAALGARSDGYQACDIVFKDTIFRKVADSDTIYEAIKHGIRYRNGFFLT